MEKEDKVILRQLVKTELKVIKKEEGNVNFASLKFIKSLDKYEEKLKELIKKLK